MRRLSFVLILLVLALSVISFTGCNGEPGAMPDSTHTVSYYIDGEIYNTASVKHGERAIRLAPDKESYISFTHWYLDSSLYTPYDFSAPVKNDLRLYAERELDGISFTNAITEKAMSSSVKIKATHHKTNILGIKVDSLSTIGSGVVFKIIGNTAYILTNCHVARANEGYTLSEYTVTDYVGNEYEAELYYEPHFERYAIDPSYDLAILALEFTSTPMNALSLADSNPKEGDFVAAMSSPQGQFNALTLGQVKKYDTISLDNVSPYYSDVKFPIIMHTAVLTGGSSGSVLINTDFEIVGINYASRITDDGGFSEGRTIPVEKVKEFLQASIYGYAWIIK